MTTTNITRKTNGGLSD